MLCRVIASAMTNPSRRSSADRSLSFAAALRAAVLEKDSKRDKAQLLLYAAIIRVADDCTCRYALAGSVIVTFIAVFLF